MTLFQFLLLLVGGGAVVSMIYWCGYWVGRMVERDEGKVAANRAKKEEA